MASHLRCAREADLRGGQVAHALAESALRLCLPDRGGEHCGKVVEKQVLPVDGEAEEAVEEAAHIAELLCRACMRALLQRLLGKQAQLADCSGGHQRKRLSEVAGEACCCASLRERDARMHACMTSD